MSQSEYNIGIPELAWEFMWASVAAALALVFNIMADVYEELKNVAMYVMVTATRIGNTVIVYTRIIIVRMSSSFERVIDTFGRVFVVVLGLVGAFIGFAVGFPLLAKFWPQAEQGLNDLMGMWTNSTTPYISDVGTSLLNLVPLFLAILIPFAIIAIVVAVIRNQ